MGVVSKVGKHIAKSAAKSIHNKAKEMNEIIEGDQEPKHSITYYFVIIIIAIVIWFIYFFSIIFNKLSSSAISEYNNVQLQSREIRLIDDDNILLASTEINGSMLTVTANASSGGIVQNAFRGFWRFLNELDPGETISHYDINAPFDEILNKLINIIKDSYGRRITELNAGITYMITGTLPDDYISLYGYAVSLSGISTDSGCQPAEDHNLTATIESLNYAINQGRCLNYAAIISILNMDSRFDIENVSYMEWKDFFRSDEVRHNLCQIILEDAYCQIDESTNEPVLNEDGSIMNVDRAADGAVLYYSVTLQNISITDLFDLIGVDANEQSTVSPSYTNYELAMERELFIRSKAPNVDFGDSDIDYTIMSNYTSAYVADLEIPTTGMSVPIYHQQDYGNAMYGPMTIADAGCCPTSLAMVVTYYTGNTVTPLTICSNPNYAAACVEGQGTNSSILFPRVCNDYGLNYTKIINPTATHIINALNEGKLVIISVRAGKFTRGGHFMVIRGCTEDGYFLINDPNIYNFYRYQTDKFTINDIMTDIVNAYIVWQ